MRFGVIGVGHGHIVSQVQKLLEAGAEGVGVYGNDDERLWAQFTERFPQLTVVDDPRRLLEDPTIEVITTAGVPAERARIAIEAMRHGKDVLTDKPGCTTLEQVAELRRTVAETGRFWCVNFGERVSSRAVARAAELIADGAIGTVVQTMGTGPHRLRPETRPDWFFQPERAGGILIDIASHQFDQFLYFTGSSNAEVVAASVGNFANPEHPAFEDFGEALVRTPHAQGYIRVDWYSPGGLNTFGDGRVTILGTEGYLELRKNVDLAGRSGGDHLFLVDHHGDRYIDCSEQRLSFYPDFLRAVRERTQTAVSTESALAAMELAITAQDRATRVGRPAR